MSFFKSGPMRSLRSSIQPAEANWAVQIVSISITSVSPPPWTAVLILSRSSLYCTWTWLTLIPVAFVKSAMSGWRRLLVSVQSMLIDSPVLAAGVLLVAVVFVGAGFEAAAV